MIDYTYIVFCIKFDLKPNRTESLEIYKKAKNQKKHDGDCIDEAQTCMKCLFQECEIDAQNIENYINNLKK